MIMKIAFSMIISVTVVIALNSWLKKKWLSKLSGQESYRAMRIEASLYRINYPNKLFGRRINDRELIQILLDYSMQTDNYESALRNVRRIERLSKSTEVKEVAKRAKDVLYERLSGVAA